MEEFNNNGNQPYNNENNEYYNSEQFNPQGQYYPTQNMNTTTTDKVSVGFCILGWFIPLFALIYFLTKKSEKPKGAKAVGIVGLVSFILNLIVVIISFAMMGNALNFADKVIENVDDWNSSSYNEEFDNTVNDILDANSDWSLNEEATNQENTTQSSNTSSYGKANWQDHKITVKGITIQLPIAYSDFKSKTELEMKSNYKTETLKSNTYTMSVPCVDSAGDTVCYIRLINVSDSTKSIEECMVAGISSYVSTYSQTGFDWVIADGGIKVGDTITLDKLKEIYDDPYDVYDSDDGDFHIYKWQTDSVGYENFEVTCSDGKISKISLEYMDYYKN